MLSKKPVIIVGAGIAGLSLAYLLAKKGRRVILIEQEKQTGGLARSFSYDGFTFDIGPHRFHSDNKQVTAFIREILGDDILTLSRASAVRMFDRYLSWPLTLKAALSFPMPVILKVALEMLKMPANDQAGTFETYILARYGRTIYSRFFLPYTRKFIKLEPDTVAREWAITGIDRAVIDKNVPMENLWELVRSLFRPASPLNFLYPHSGGIGVFIERLSDLVLENGGEIRLGCTVSRIQQEDSRVSAVEVDGELLDCDALVWSAPLHDLSSAMGIPLPFLNYLHIVQYNIQVDHPPLLPYQWLYFGDEDIPFNRISVPMLFNPLLAPHGKMGIAVECTCRSDEKIWHAPEIMLPRIIKSLCDVGVLLSPDSVSGTAFERIRNAYPVYELGFERHRDTFLDDVKRRVHNLYPLGRTGRFWYNNMDNSIEDSFRVYSELMGEPS